MPGVDGGDLAPRHVLGLLDRALDRGDGGVDVDHHALPQPLRRVRADADDVDALVGHLADDGADLRRPDVEADEDVSGLRHDHLRASSRVALRPSAPSRARSTVSGGRDEAALPPPSSLRHRQPDGDPVRVPPVVEVEHLRALHRRPRAPRGPARGARASPGAPRVRAGSRPLVGPTHSVVPYSTSMWISEIGARRSRPRSAQRSSERQGAFSSGSTSPRGARPKPRARSR